MSGSVFGMSGLIFLVSDLYFDCMDLYLVPWTHICVSGLIFVCLDLYFGCLDLYFGCLNLYFGCPGRVGSGGRPGRVSSTFGEKQFWGSVSIIEFWTWGIFIKKTRAEKCCILACCTGWDLSYETDSGPKTKTDWSIYFTLFSYYFHIFFSHLFHIIFTFLGICHFVYAQYRMDITTRHPVRVDVCTGATGIKKC